MRSDSPAGLASLGCRNAKRYLSGADFGRHYMELSGRSAIEHSQDRAASKLSENPMADVVKQARQPPKGSLPVLGLTALGIVFGDIGTSPLYTFKTILSATE